jgi:hypothetical protein
MKHINLASCIKLPVDAYQDVVVETAMLNDRLALTISYRETRVVFPTYYQQNMY